MPQNPHKRKVKPPPPNKKIAKKLQEVVDLTAKGTIAGKHISQMNADGKSAVVSLLLQVLWEHSLMPAVQKLVGPGGPCEGAQVIYQEDNAGPHTYGDWLHPVDGRKIPWTRLAIRTPGTAR